MKSLKSVFPVLALIIMMCDVTVDEWACILNCNPAECLVLDEEDCECVIDPICEAENFCGGDVEDFRCKEKDGGSCCTALTGDSIKTWKFDDVTQPSKIIYKREYTVNYPGWHEFERKIIKLNSDTIILTWPDENEFKGGIAYVPI